MLNVTFLVTCILIVLFSILYFFFWNRAFGYFLGFLVRLTLWTQNRSAVWVDFGSVHLSLLAGRILLRDVRYHSSNQTFRIVKCQINWRYWVRHAAEEEDLADMHSEGESGSEKYHRRPHSCRIHVGMEGFEWYMYNRIAAFESILTHLSSTDTAFTGLKAKSRESNAQSLNTVQERGAPPYSRVSTYASGRRVLESIHLPAFLYNFFIWVQQQLPDLDPKSLLPVSIEVTKGAITMGNHSTESLLLAQFKSASGTYGVVQSRSKFDLHKQLLRLKFCGAVINLEENSDYWATVQKLGEDVHVSLAKTEANRTRFTLTFRDFDRLWSRARSSFSYFKLRRRRYAKPEKDQKKKSKKMHEEESHIGADFTKLEYAVDRKLLEAQVLELTYYADVAGYVPNIGYTLNSDVKNLESMDIGNGDLPPEWGVEVISVGGSIHYGPWADRQRVQLQRVFFPQTFQHINPTEMLAPGDQRTCTCLKLLFEFRGVTTIHIPFREASKNWQWDGLKDIPHDTRQREAASLQFRMGDNSSIKYLVPMVSTADAYIAELEVFMENVSVLSSLNDIRLLDAGSYSLSSKLPSPLEWDSERSWNFEIHLENPIYYLIRDHINMLTDLGKDWSSGPPSDYNTFVPITYGLNMTFHNFELNLYANDHNIIDRPLDEMENTLFTYAGVTLRSCVTIPLKKFRPLSTTLQFDLSAPNLSLSLSLPRWNTHSLAASPVLKQLSNVGSLKDFRVAGSYLYHAEVRDDCIDQLKLKFASRMVAFKLFGWVVRHVMVWRENYFGSFTQYSTTREYLERRERGIVGDPLELKYRPGKNNGFHLDLSVALENCRIAMPAGLPGYERGDPITGQAPREIDIGACAIYTFSNLQVLLRLHDHAMDMSLNCDPVFLSLESSCPDNAFLNHGYEPSKQPVAISGLSITSNRLFGPQPRGIAYVCIWNISVGEVRGFLDTYEGSILALAGRSFIFGFSDPLNAPSAEFTATPDRDATFLKLSVENIELSWSAKPATVRVSLPDGFQFFFNNIAGGNYRKMTSISMPIIELQLLACPRGGETWLETCRLRSSVSLDMYQCPSGWRQDAELQRSFLDSQDRETNRFRNMFEVPRSSRLSKWWNSIYLQDVGAPHVARKRAAAELTQVHLPSRRQSRRMRHSKGYDWRSDSDEDLQVSDLARDKRLADSRPSSLAVWTREAYDSRSSTSLDESDSEDQSVSDGHWSDYSAVHDGHDDKLPYARYWSFCRQFKLHQEPSTFVCYTEYERMENVEELSMFSSHQSEVSRNKRKRPVAQFTGRLPPNSNDALNKTFIRIDVTTTSIFLTPLVVRLSEEISEILPPAIHSPELLLDMLTLSSVSTSSESLVVYDMQLDSVEARFVQDLMAGREMMDLSPSFPLVGVEGEHCRVVSIVDLKLADVRLLFNTNSEGPSISESGPLGQVAVGVFKASLGFMLSSHRLNDRRARAPPATAIEAQVKSIAGSVSSTAADLFIESSNLILHRSAPEIGLATGSALDVNIRKLLSVKSEFSSRSRRRLQCLLHIILEQGNDLAPKDLFSAIQPSFFVQSGRPQKLRQDVNWRLLFHLRYLLADFHDDIRETLIQCLESEKDMSIKLESLRSYQLPWAADEGFSVMDVDFMQAAFNERRTDPKHDIGSHRNDTRPAFAFGFRSKSFQVAFMDGNAIAQNTFEVIDINFRADVLRRRLIIVAHTHSPFSSTVRSAMPTDPVDYGSLTLVITLSIASVQLAIFPSILSFLQNAIHAWKLRSPSLQNKDNESPAKNSFLGLGLQDRIIACDTRISLHRMLIEAAAENIIFDVDLQDFSSSGIAHISRPRSASPFHLDVSLNHAIGFEGVSIRTRTRLFSEAKYRSNDVLAAINISGALFCLLFQNHTPQGLVARSTSHVNSMELNVPRSAIRLYHFIEQWKQDYLVGIDAMMKSLFSEFKQPPKLLAERKPPTTLLTGILDINASIASLSVILQVMHGTWLSWSSHNIVIFDKSQPRKDAMSHVFGLQLGSQMINITSTTPTGSRESHSESKINLELPAVRATGTSNSDQMQLLVSVGILKMTIKPSHWDALLSVQQKFGQDFNDLLLIVSEKGRSRPRQVQKAGSAAFSVMGKFEGFKIGVEGAASTQILECTNIDAVLNNDGPIQWQVTLSDLTLYLSPTHSRRGKYDIPGKAAYPIFISIDSTLTSYRPEMLQDLEARLDLSVIKFHAVLQANMIGEVGDFFDDLQSEVLLRKEQRAIELTEFKGKARKVMQTFNMNPRASALTSDGGFLSERTVKLSMTNFGAAVPLKQPPNNDIVGTESEASHHTRAFLICIDSLTFQTSRGEIGQALMRGFSFQFVSRFNPSDPEDYSASNHQTLNRLLYPEMTARLSSETSSSARKVFVTSEVSGFILDLDPSITTFAFALVDIYRQGKQRVEKLASVMPRSVFESEPTSPEPDDSVRNSDRQILTVSSTIKASMRFLSGTIRMHAMSMRDLPKFSLFSPDWLGRTYQILDPDVELFRLPEVSVWSEYRVDAGNPGPSTLDRPSPVLVFKATVHSSHNILRPSLLPFITELVRNIEHRMKADSTSNIRLQTPSSHGPSSARSIDEMPSSAMKQRANAASGLQIIFSLRIDQSRLELTCKPDVNVVARLHWESGGFLLNISPGGRGVTVSACIGGLTAGIRHGFLSDDSAYVDAHNLNFSVNFAKSELPFGRIINAISVVVETEFSGSIRFSRLQDFLCFKAVWLDHIPILNNDAPANSGISQFNVTSVDTSSRQGFDTAVVIRVRQITLDVDLGQSISTVTLGLHSARACTRLTEESSEISVSVDRVDTQARGNLSGHVRVPDFMFRTIRRRDGRDNSAQPLGRTLELHMTSGTLDIQLQSDWLWLLQYRAEPFEATVYDEWPSPTMSTPDTQFQLYFSVIGSKVVAMMTIMAIPKIVMYAGKFMQNLEAQREGASRESSAFRSAQLPKPDNALSEVANAMFQTARTKLKETEKLTYVIGEHMKLKLDELIFVLLPRSQGDNELARFIGRDIMAQLERVVRPDSQPVHRDLRLSLSHMSISQLIKQGFDPRLPGQEFDVLTSSGRHFGGVENVIFSLPAIDMRMVSDEEQQGGLKVLPYDFDSNFARLEGQRRSENISITFNISLYSWLTVLRKTFTRELKRAHEVPEWKSTTSPLASTTASPAMMHAPVAVDRPEQTRDVPSSPARSKSLESVIPTFPRRRFSPRSPTLHSSATLVQHDLGSLSPSRSPVSTGVSPPMAASPATSPSYPPSVPPPPKKSSEIVYKVRRRRIERLTVRQLGEATPDVMHPFFTKRAGFNLEDALPQYVHEYATVPIEEIMRALVKLYSKQLKLGRT